MALVMDRRRQALDMKINLCVLIVFMCCHFENSTVRAHLVHLENNTTQEPDLLIRNGANAHINAADINDPFRTNTTNNTFSRKSSNLTTQSVKNDIDLFERIGDYANNSVTLLDIEDIVNAESDTPKSVEAAIFQSFTDSGTFHIGTDDTLTSNTIAGLEMSTHPNNKSVKNPNIVLSGHKFTDTNIMEHTPNIDKHNDLNIAEMNKSPFLKGDQSFMQENTRNVEKHRHHLSEAKSVTAPHDSSVHFNQETERNSVKNIEKGSEGDTSDPMPGSILNGDNYSNSQTNLSYHSISNNGFNSSYGASLHKSPVPDERNEIEPPDNKAHNANEKDLTFPSKAQTSSKPEYPHLNISRIRTSTTENMNNYPPPATIQQDTSYLSKSYENTSFAINPKSQTPNTSHSQSMNGAHIETPNLLLIVPVPYIAANDTEASASTKTTHKSSLVDFDYLKRYDRFTLSENVLLSKNVSNTPDETKNLRTRSNQSIISQDETNTVDKIGVFEKTSSPSGFNSTYTKTEGPAKHTTLASRLHAVEKLTETSDYQGMITSLDAIMKELIIKANKDSDISEISDVTQTEILRMGNDAPLDEKKHRDEITMLPGSKPFTTLPSKAIYTPDVIDSSKQPISNANKRNIFVNQTDENDKEGELYKYPPQQHLVNSSNEKRSPLLNFSIVSTNNIHRETDARDTSSKQFNKKIPYKTTSDNKQDVFTSRNDHNYDFLEDNQKMSTQNIEAIRTSTTKPRNEESSRSNYFTGYNIHPRIYETNASDKQAILMSQNLSDESWTDNLTIVNSENYDTRSRSSSTMPEFSIIHKATDKNVNKVPETNARDLKGKDITRYKYDENKLKSSGLYESLNYDDNFPDEYYHLNGEEIENMVDASFISDAKIKPERKELLDVFDYNAIWTNTGSAPVENSIYGMENTNTVIHHGYGDMEARRYFSSDKKIEKSGYHSKTYENDIDVTSFKPIDISDDGELSPVSGEVLEINHNGQEFDTERGRTPYRPSQFTNEHELPGLIRNKETPRQIEQKVPQQEPSEYFSILSHERDLLDENVRRNREQIKSVPFSNFESNNFKAMHFHNKPDNVFQQVPLSHINSPKTVKISTLRSSINKPKNKNVNGSSLLKGVSSFYRGSETNLQNKSVLNNRHEIFNKNVKLNNNQNISYEAKVSGIIASTFGPDAPGFNKEYDSRGLKTNNPDAAVIPNTTQQFEYLNVQRHTDTTQGVTPVSDTILQTTAASNLSLRPLFTPASLAAPPFYDQNGSITSTRKQFPIARSGQTNSIALDNKSKTDKFSYNSSIETENVINLSSPNFTTERNKSDDEDSVKQDAYDGWSGTSNDQPTRHFQTLSLGITNTTPADRDKSLRRNSSWEQESFISFNISKWEDTDFDSVPEIAVYRAQDFSLRQPELSAKKTDTQIEFTTNNLMRNTTDILSSTLNSSIANANSSSSNGNPSFQNNLVQADLLSLPSLGAGFPMFPDTRPRAAMSAVLTTHFGPTKDRMVPFDLELVDLGDNYDNTSGTFICTVPGTYVITLQLMSHPGAKVNARVHVNSRAVAALWADDNEGAGFYPSSSTHTLTHLDFGDQVYVMLVDGGYGDSWLHANYNGFSVYLLYEDPMPFK